jgi:hypothetical protein
MKGNHGRLLITSFFSILLMNFCITILKLKTDFNCNTPIGINISNNELGNEKAEITITNYGWLHPDPQIGIKVPRCMATRDFNDAIQAHERYNESAWRDLDANPNPQRPIIAFLDIDICKHIHWPKFNGDWKTNSDVEYGRTPLSEMSNFTFDVYSKDCIIIDKALQSPALSSPKSRLVVLSCHDLGPRDFPCLRADRNASGIYSKLVVGHLSAHRKDTFPNDFGIPPWPLKVVHLNQTQKDSIRSCRKSSRDLLFSFSGRIRKPFRAFHRYFERLHGREGIYAVFHNDHYENTTKNTWGWAMVESSGPLEQAKDLYYQLLIKSDFVGAPLGDCLYSLRFSEALAAGAIPVVYSDGWVLPYNMDVVDWSQLAVLLPQRQVRKTMKILRSIPLEKRCDMQRKGYAFFQKYLAHSSGRLRAVLEIVDKSLARPVPMTFSSAPE